MYEYLTVRGWPVRAVVESLAERDDERANKVDPGIFAAGLDRRAPPDSGVWETLFNP